MNYRRLLKRNSMAMHKLLFFLAADALLLRAPVFASELKAPVRIPEIPQNWCFCIQTKPPMQYDPMPYYLGSFPQLSPECAKMKFDPKRKNAVEELHSCKDTGRCWITAAKGAEEKKKLEKSLSDHRKLLDDCRKPISGLPARTQSTLDESCLKMWQGVMDMDVLKLRLAEGDIRQELDDCFAKAPNISSAKLALRGNNEKERNKAFSFLAGISTTTTKAIPVLIDAIGRDETRCAAIAALGDYGPAANDAVPALAGLSMEYSDCPASATIALQRIGTPDALAALKLLRKWDQKWNAREKRLFRALSDRDPAVRGNASWELHNTALSLKPTEEMQREARSRKRPRSNWELMVERKKSDKLKEITTALIPLLHDPEKTVRYRAASYLVDIDTATTAAIPVLFEAIKDDKVIDYSCAAVAALGGYYRFAPSAVSALTDPGLEKRFGSSRGPGPCSPKAILWRMGTPEAVTAAISLEPKVQPWDEHYKRLILMAAKKDSGTRIRAARELCDYALGPNWIKTMNAAFVLNRLLRDTDKDVRYTAAACLPLIDPSTKTIPVLIEAVKDPAGRYPGNAALDLGSYGMEAKEAVPALIELMNKKGFSYFRLQPASEYAAALEQIGTPEAIAALAPLRKKEMLVGALAAPFAFLVFIPLLAPLTVLFFAWLFWWSRAQQKKGRKLIHQPLLIPILGWIYISYVVMFELNKHGSFRQIYGANICLWLSVITTLAGLLPWCASWCLLRLRERRRSAGA